MDNGTLTNNGTHNRLTASRRIDPIDAREMARKDPLAFARAHTLVGTAKMSVKVSTDVSAVTLELAGDVNGDIDATSLSALALEQDKEKGVSWQGAKVDLDNGRIKATPKGKMSPVSVALIIDPDNADIE